MGAPALDIPDSVFGIWNLDSVAESDAIRDRPKKPRSGAGSAELQRPCHCGWQRGALPASALPPPSLTHAQRLLLTTDCHSRCVVGRPMVHHAHRCLTRGLEPRTFSHLLPGTLGRSCDGCPSARVRAHTDARRVVRAVGGPVRPGGALRGAGSRRDRRLLRCMLLLRESLVAAPCRGACIFRQHAARVS